VCPIWLPIFFLFSIMNQNWVQKSILAWFWHHFHLALDWTGIKPTTFQPWAQCSTARPQLSLNIIIFIAFVFTKVIPEVILLVFWSTTLYVRFTITVKQSHQITLNFFWFLFSSVISKLVFKIRFSWFKRQLGQTSQNLWSQFF